jgi:hypothetical protein
MTQVKFDIPLPDAVDPSDYEAVADEILEFIRSRTEAGRNKNNGRFPGYSESYIKSLDFRAAGKSAGKVDLTLSGDMLISLQMLEAADGWLTLGFDEGEIENDKALGNIKGTYGQAAPIKGKKRDFLGIALNDLSKIVAPYAEDMSTYKVLEFLRANYDTKQSEKLPLS